MRWLRERRAHLIGWWRAKAGARTRRGNSPALEQAIFHTDASTADQLQASDLAPAFSALSFFFRPAALVAGALYVHERIEQRRRYERAVRRARIAWALLTVAGLALGLLAWLR